MFCKAAHCALVAMITLTRCGGSKGMSIQEIAQQNNIPVEAFEGVTDRLAQCGYVKIEDGLLWLNIRPEEVTIWQILQGVTGENLFQGDFYDEISWQHRLHPSSTTTMLNKERGVILRIIEGRLSRYKLSQWSEKASKTVYV